MEWGYFGHFFGGPLTVAPDRSTIVKDVSSRYAPLYQYYDFDLNSMLKNARDIDGTVVAISDDIRPLNYCQWIANWLPRLAFLGAESRRRSVYVLTTPLTAAFQRETLHMCGFDDSRIIELEEFSAIRARELLVPSDLRLVPHPIHKAAPWAVAYLHSAIGLPSVMAESSGRTHGKLYVSRKDAWRRQVSNDADLSNALSKLGYRTITLSDLTVSQQVAEFAYASHVVSLHGAGLTNLIFAQTGTKVIEIFSRTYGTPAFGVIASGQECPYASYIADRTISRQITQFDDVEVDITNFLDICGEFL
jgi:capsular polysaccharide biosynthesis protein